MNSDFYAILGVAKDSSQVEVKAAYVRLSKVLHPDVNPHGATLMQAVNEAYEVLGDAKKRAAYDRHQKRPICMCGGTMCDGSKHHANDPKQARPKVSEFVAADGTLNFFAMTASVTPDAMRESVLPLVGQLFKDFGLNAERASVSDVLGAAGFLKKRRARKSA